MPGLRRCTYVQGCAQSWDSYLWMLLWCIFYFFTHRKWYNCWSALKMYLTRALFPKTTFLVTARGGAVFWSCLIFLFLTQGTVSISDKSPRSVHTALSWLLYRSKGGRTIRAMPFRRRGLLPKSCSRTLISCVIFFYNCDMPLINSAGVIDWKHNLSAFLDIIF